MRRGEHHALLSFFSGVLFFFPLSSLPQGVVYCPEWYSGISAAPPCPLRKPPAPCHHTWLFTSIISMCSSIIGIISRVEYIPSLLFPLFWLRPVFRWCLTGTGLKALGEVLGIAETAGIGDLFDGEIRLL